MEKWKFLFVKLLFVIKYFITNFFSVHYVHFYLGYTKVCNHSQPPATVHNHPQPLTTAQELHKKAKTYHKQLCYLLHIRCY